MKFSILILLLLSSINSHAWEPIELGDVYITAKKMGSNNEPFMPPGSRADLEINLGVNLVFFDNFYVDNMVWTQTDQSQYRTVGWNWKLGFRLTKEIEFGWEHFSRHTLDVVHPLGSFNYDAAFMKIRFRDGPKARPLW